eukprot:1387698-Alexandrium_andersonii.AAC.1
MLGRSLGDVLTCERHRLPVLVAHRPRLGHAGVHGVVDHDGDASAEVPLVGVGVVAHVTQGLPES